MVAGRVLARRTLGGLTGFPRQGLDGSGGADTANNVFNSPNVKPSVSPLRMICSRCSSLDSSLR